MSQDWIKAWGEVSILNGVLHLQASTSSTGGDTFLDGAQKWDNYDFEANINWINGSTVSVIAREIDTNNFTYCDFGNGEATIIEKIAGNDTVIGSNHAPNGPSGSVYNFGIRVYGNEVACTVDGEEVASALMKYGAPATGSIGFITWDPASSTASIAVNQISVQPLLVNNIIVPFQSPDSKIAEGSQQDTIATSSSSSDQVSSSSAPAAAISSATTLTLPYNENDFSNDVNWTATWGTMNIDPNSHAMNLQASITTTGAVEVLKNSESWSDYQLNATVDWVKGEVFGLVGRYSRDNTYVECTFIESATDVIDIELQQYVNGEETTLAEGSVMDFDPHASTLNASMLLYNTGETCMLDAHRVSNMPADLSVRGLNPPFSGGIGFAVWDPTSNNAQIIVREVSVEQAYSN